METDESWASNTYSTSHALDYTLHSRPQQFGGRCQKRCTLVAVTLADGLHLQIPCFDHHNFTGRRLYFQHYERVLADALCSHFLHIPRCCAREIASTFMERTVLCAAATHRCPLLPRFRPTALYVMIQIRPQDVTDTVIRESFEEVGPRSRPATIDSVKELLATKADHHRRRWNASDHECVICMDKIRTRRSSLKMECAHVFHQHCLIRWLKTSHVCPLCRYQMPRSEN